MDLNLQGRKVLITGAADGIGRSLALDFAAQGAQVAGCARSVPRLNALATEIEGDGHLFHPADMTQVKEIQAFYDKVMETLGGLDILVNNVGSILNLKNFLDVSDEEWETSFQINLMSAVRMTRLCLPALRRSGAPRIINISSVAANRPGTVFPHYSAMKAALSNLTVSLAQTLAGDKILVNSVSPGPVWTRSWEKEARQAAETSGGDLSSTKRELESQTAQSLLLQRMGIPEDIAGLVLFLASDQAGWITASNFIVDGGLSQDPY
ncbi:MAG: SDR family oxidoreductase [Nitrospinaceae bacterium]|nr:SDR family oxidoreductase [Nitrospinaceae bacterium]NIR55223.1 SDR family oxidoreductase [Nitrospinaceae bacterium]NIS85650.1 SDR family oxidoreductase [Nitrospinaceae bacterium]NIT82495.1 SDR family oxidoreductase [Nitrospinaceae bacterium]NIU44700.1 SDR family oxidoreductase [Nitrospinaceae bacterium]